MSSESPTHTSGPKSASTAAAPVDGARLAPGTIMAGRYRIVALLGRGGMGEVFRADDLKLRQTVALKFLPPDLAADPDRLARLHEEVRVARQVSHPNVCRVHDIGDSDLGPFLSMEHIDGEDLASLLRRVGRLTEDKALELGRQVCAGLAAAHAAGVLHRDLKPANVMLDSAGHARITDFGLAVALASRRAAGEVAGTPAYMAPEQIAGEPASAQTDLWSFGVLLYEILTGKRPFAGRSLAELAREQRESPPPPPSSLVSAIGPGVDAIVERCLAPDPRQRPRAAMEVLTALTGGDALGAAVAAGQTPSPEAVAAAGSEGALRPATAWACFVGILVCIPAYFFLGSRFSIVEHAVLERPSEVLAARAQDIVEQLGLGEPGAVSSCGFGNDNAALTFLASHARPPGTAPWPIVFWCRRGTQRPVGRDPRNQISDREPPPAPGEVVTVLDPAGRLLRLVAVPGRGWTAGAKEPEETWATLFRFAGIDRAQFVPEPPAELPPVYADARSAWRAGPGPFAELRVEAALLSGRPVSFEVLGPWDEESRTGESRTGPPGLVGAGAIPSALVLVLFVVAVLLAWRNLQRTRGDLRGARRVGAVIVVLYLVRWVGSGRHTPVLENELDLLGLGLSRALAIAVFVAILYLALEPYVRRRWPQSLVSWSRLLAGRVTDPMVARDVLIAEVSLFGVVMFATAILVPFLAGQLVPLPRELLPLLGMRQVIGAVAGAAIAAIQTGMIFLLLLLLTHSIGRRRIGGLLFAAAMGVLMLSWWGAATGSSLGAGALPIAFGALYVFLLTRFGLLAAVVAMYGSLLGLLLPDAVSLSAWYAFCSWTLVLVHVALAGYGLWFSVGKEPLVGWGGLDR